MKTYSNRKYYNFTKAHKQRAKSERIGRWCKVGKEYAKLRQRLFRARCRSILLKIESGQEAEFPRFRKTDDWDGC